MKKVIAFITGVLLSNLLYSQVEYTEVNTVAECANMRSDRRPIPVGYYDETVDKTFVCWMAEDSHPVVKAYDHTRAVWSENKRVADSPFLDKHNYPGMLRGKDGRIYLFYGCHNSTLKMAVSPSPGSIEGEWEDGFIEEAERASYPAPILTENGTFYVFYRDTRRTNGYSDDRPYQVVKSTDHGKTWKRQLVIDPFPRVTDNMTEVYNGQVTYQPPVNGQKERIHLAWTVCGEKLGRHAHATYGRNVYYAYLDPETDRMYNIEGVDLGTTIDSEACDKYCLVLETPIPERGHAAGLQVSVHYRDNSSPVIHYQYAREGSGQLSTWEDGKWHHQPFGSGSEPRGLEKLGADRFRIYSTMGPGLVTFITNDGGITIERESQLETPLPLSRCYVIENARPELKLLMFSVPRPGVSQELRMANRDVYSVGVTNKH